MTISSSGLPTAISKMVSERVTLGDERGAKQVFKNALILLAIIGVITIRIGGTIFTYGILVILDDLSACFFGKCHVLDITDIVGVLLFATVPKINAILSKQMATAAMAAQLVELRKVYEQVVERVESFDKEANGYKELHSRRLVEIAGYILISHLMLRQATEVEADYLNAAKIFVKYAAKKITEAAYYINTSEKSDVELFG